MPNPTITSQPIRPEPNMSVSEATRLAKEALAHAEVQAILMGEGGPVPVTGDYYDAIRATQQVRTGAPKALTNQFVRGIYNQRGGVKSYAAATYKYPSQQMVIGASLAGNRVPMSPAEDRRRQMEVLMGLGASENVGETTSSWGGNDYKEAPLKSYSKYAITDANEPGKRYSGAPNPPMTTSIPGYTAAWARPAFQQQTGYKGGSPTRGCYYCNFNSADDALVAAYCDLFYADSAENNAACGQPGSFAPWTPGGALARGLPNRGQGSELMLRAYAKKLGQTYEEVKKQAGVVSDTLGPGGGGAPPAGGGGGGGDKGRVPRDVLSIDPNILRRELEKKLKEEPPKTAAGGGGVAIVAGVAAVALVAVLLSRKK